MVSCLRGLTEDSESPGRSSEIRRTPQSTEPKVERAVLVGLDGPDAAGESLDELALLTDTAGGAAMGRVIQRRGSIEPSTFLSKGKLQQVRDLILLHDASLLIADEDLSPAQARNLERDLKVRVVDRSELILDIFARRARTREAMLQVELAQLEYQLPRLARMWTHLERQSGGIGTRGPGETQIESDRRRIRTRIAVLKEKLEKIDQEREVQRKGRSEYFRAALVGYTNAGKSTLFNALAKANVLTEDKLFATLDTTTRKVFLPGDQKILLSDTVGFIKKLPHHLVASFRATLMEVREADLIVHIVDASHPRHEGQMKAVEAVLSEILDRDVERMVVLNKADLFTDDTAAYGLRLRYPDAAILSAVSDSDVELFRGRLAEELGRVRTRVRLAFPSARLDEARSILRRGMTVSESYADGMVYGEYALTRPDIDRLRQSRFRVRFLKESGT